MNLFTLILKNMRQRLLSTLLTLLSVALGVALASSTLIVSREGQQAFAQTDFGYDLLIGPKASPLQLVLNTVYHLDQSPGNIPYALYEDLTTNQSNTPYRGLARWAVPYAVGDNWRGHRIIGTSTRLFGIADDGTPLAPDRTPEYRQGLRYQFTQGRCFHPEKFEAIVGSEVARIHNLSLGSTIKATHGSAENASAHDEHEEEWKVVGILQETKTANDRVLFIPLLSFYAIAEHEKALEAASLLKSSAPATATAQDSHDEHEGHDDHDHAYHLHKDGTIHLHLDKSKWELSAILVQTRSAATALQLQYLLRNKPDAIGVSPAAVMRQFFDTFLAGSLQVLVLISTLVTIVAGIGILVSIYNSVTSRTREIAIMRALGATRARILTTICLEAAIVGLLGGLTGLLLGHLLAAAGSAYLQNLLGTSIAWWQIGALEMLYLAATVAVAFLAGLVPALKAYRTDVASNLN